MSTPQTEKYWTYYSSLVPGYKEKYGLRGMRERNRKLLKRLKTAQGKERKRLQNLLAENNLPYAKYVSEIYCNYYGLTSKKEEYYQICLSALAKHILSLHDEDDYRQAYFQNGMYYKMLGQISGAGKLSIIENKCIFVSFDENTFPQEIKMVPDKEQIFRYLRICLTEREINIIEWYYFGNAELHIMPESFEDIGFTIGLTRERVRQIMEKALKKVRKVFNALANEKDFSIEIFLKDGM